MAVVAVENGVQVRQRAFFPVAADAVINVGDPLWYDTTNHVVKEASTFTWTSSNAATRRDFKRYFAGIALNSHRSGDPADVLPVAVVAECDATVASGTFEPKDLVGLTGNGAALLNTSLTSVADPAEAVGTVMRRYPSSVTTARVYIHGAMMGLSVGERTLGTKTFQMPFSNLAIVAVNMLTNMSAYQAFNGSAEVMECGFIEDVAVGTQNLNVIMGLNQSNLATLNVPSSGGARGRVTTQDQSSNSFRKFDANDKLNVFMSQNATGSGTFFIRYRPLS